MSTSDNKAEKPVKSICPDFIQQVRDKVSKRFGPMSISTLINLSSFNMDLIQSVDFGILSPVNQPWLQLTAFSPFSLTWVVPGCTCTYIYIYIHIYNFPPTQHSRLGYTVSAREQPANGAFSLGSGPAGVHQTDIKHLTSTTLLNMLHQAITNIDHLFPSVCSLPERFQKNARLSGEGCRGG
jgi:hypothetical protein